MKARLIAVGIVLLAGSIWVSGCSKDASTQPTGADGTMSPASGSVQYRTHTCLGLCSGNRHFSQSGEPVVVVSRFGQLVEVVDP
jgi:hypothetical protein